MTRSIMAGCLAVLLAACSSVLPHESSAVGGKFRTYDQLMASYDKIALGRTRTTDLSPLGFDPHTTPNVAVLSYLDIIKRFVPNDAMSLRHVPKPVRDCIDAQNRCSAYLYHLQHTETHHNGAVIPDLIGTERDTTRSGWSAEIILVLRDDNVVYKVMSGMPNLEERHDKSQPLGPLQDLGNSLTGSAPR